MLEVNRSSYCAFSRKQQGSLRFRAKVLALHQASRGAAGVNTLSQALKAEGELGQQLAQYIYEWLTSSIKISRRGSANNSSACLAKA